MIERPPRPTGSSATILHLQGVNVFYGRGHALQGVDLSLHSGVLSVVGRNGMGKTTMCKAIMGLVRVSSGSIRFMGEELVGRSPAEIARMGIGYVPQGRRLWRSLTVDEHLNVMSTGKGSWTPERIYETFPRLAERRRNSGAELSGGEQQMLAISRGLLMNPRLLIMDEPTEGLAPVIVAGAARRGRRRLNSCHRAEYRRCNSDVRSRRHHGQRTDQSRDRITDACGRSRPPAASPGRGPAQP